MKAMVLAAGMGTRLGELTNHKPKALVEVAGRPLVYHIIQRLIAHGFSTIIVNVHHFHSQLIEYLTSQSWDAEILISDESAQLLDTGGAILHAKSLLGEHEPFLVHNVDIISSLNLKALYDFHVAHNPMATLAVAKRDSTRQLLFNPQMSLCGWENLKTNEQIIVHEHDTLMRFAFSGIHVVSPSFFKEVKHKGVFSIIHAYLDLCKSHALLGFDTTNCFLMDAGKTENLSTVSEFIEQSANGQNGMD